MGPENWSMADRPTEDDWDLIQTQVDHYGGSLFISKYSTGEGTDGGGRAWYYLGVVIVDGVVFRSERCKSVREVFKEIARVMAESGN